MGFSVLSEREMRIASVWRKVGGSAREDVVADDMVGAGDHYQVCAVRVPVVVSWGRERMRMEVKRRRR